VEGSSESHLSRLTAARREGERVTPLELFFDLVFVLAITQCTASMAHHPTWAGLAQGLLILEESFATVLPHDALAPPSELVEPLTPRELEVLQRMRCGWGWWCCEGCLLIT